LERCLLHANTMEKVLFQEVDRFKEKRIRPNEKG